MQTQTAEVAEVEPTEVEIKVSDKLATLAYPQDRYPVYIVRRTPKTLICRAISHDHIKATDFCNGFPVMDHQYTEAEAEANLVGNEFKVYWSKRGWRHGGCIPLWLGTARYFRNHAD